MSNKSDEIIRCKDCRHHSVYTVNGETKSHCAYFSGYFSVYFGPYDVKENDYCSRAIRNGDEDNET